jgi:succinyl-diaminopimelate desuccinylase
MKGSVAAMTVACERFRAAHPDHAGRLAILLTSDEEGPARDGTRRVIETLNERGERIDWCLVGEPSSREVLGDTIKNGRRGSLTARITVRGRQGHVAYPQVADNALHRLLAALLELIAVEWDAGDEHFPPTSLQVSNLDAGTGADNVIPGRAEACLNLRFSPALTETVIRERVTALVARHAPDHRIDWHLSGSPFFTADGELLDAVRAATTEITGRTPELSTAGGTSDGRFLAPAGAQVVELGPLNASIHRVDEHVRSDDLTTLARIYESVIERLLVTG